jgi:hypothetical protein
MGVADNSLKKNLSGTWKSPRQLRAAPSILVAMVETKTENSTRTESKLTGPKPTAWTRLAHARDENGEQEIKMIGH